MNKHFQAVFTRKKDWNEEEGQVMRSPPMSELIVVTREEIMNSMMNLDARKSHGPDGIAF